MPRLRLPHLLYFLPLAFLAVFYFYPLLSILGLGFAPEGRLQFGGLVELVARPYFARVLWFTFWQAVASTVLTLLLGLPAAYVFARYDFPAKSVLRALTTIPFVMPTVVVGAAFVTLFGPHGVLNEWLVSTFGLEQPPINLLYTFWIILLAHAFYNATVVVRIVGGFWSNLDPRLGEAAAVLGAPRWRRSVEITLPLLMPSIIAAALLVFLFCFTSFGVILILGGPRFATLEVETYRQAVNYFNLPLAAALALVQLGLTFIVMIVYTRLQARASLPLNLRPQSLTARRPATWREWALVIGALAYYMRKNGIPIIAMVLGFILGPNMEELFRRAMSISNGNPMTFFTSPDSLFFIVLTAIFVYFLCIKKPAKIAGISDDAV